MHLFSGDAVRTIQARADEKYIPFFVYRILCTPVALLSMIEVNKTLSSKTSMGNKVGTQGNTDEHSAAPPPWCDKAADSTALIPLPCPFTRPLVQILANS